jgi:AcrR family transcriptional regulator
MLDSVLNQVRQSGRRPGVSRSREDIAAAARRLFAARGYDGVTIRAIATDAGVDPALVHHFFGTKQQLFDRLVDLSFEPADVIDAALAPGMEGLGERIVRFMITRMRDPEAGECMVAMVRTAAAQPAAARLLREFYARRLLEPLARGLNADEPQLRAALCSSQLLGLAVAEHVLGLPPLVRASTEQLVCIYGPTLQRYLTAPLPDLQDETAPPRPRRLTRRRAYLE